MPERTSATHRPWPPDRQYREEEGGRVACGVVPRPRMAKALLTPREVDFPRWYQDVIAKAELAENGPVRGPWSSGRPVTPSGSGCSAEMDDRIKAAGAENAYFPLLIPESYLQREAEHVEGFSRNWRWSPSAGASNWRSRWSSGPPARRSSASSWPNGSTATGTCRCCSTSGQTWCAGSCGPGLFLRTTEFLWQEGHTAHASRADARAYALRILHEVYEDVMVNVLASRWWWASRPRGSDSPAPRPRTRSRR